MKNGKTKVHQNAIELNDTVCSIAGISADSVKGKEILGELLFALINQHHRSIDEAAKVLVNTIPAEAHLTLKRSQGGIV